MLAHWNHSRPGVPTRKITVPRLSEKWYREGRDSCKHLPPERQQRYNEYAAQYDKQGHVWVPEYKSPKETWRLPKQVYQGIVLVAVATAQWTLALGVSPKTCEYAMRGYLADHAIPRLRRSIGALMRAKEAITPYLYCSFKLKCWAGEGPSRRTCTKPGHSCTRKIVSFIHLPGRRLNKRFHRAAQTLLQELPTWELLSLIHI